MQKIAAALCTHVIYKHFLQIKHGHIATMSHDMLTKSLKRMFWSNARDLRGRIKTEFFDFKFGVSVKRRTVVSGARVGRPGGARVVRGAEKKSFDRGGPVWPPRSNVTNLCPPSQNPGVWGQHPPAKTEKLSKNFPPYHFCQKGGVPVVRNSMSMEVL